MPGGSSVSVMSVCMLSLCMLPQVNCGQPTIRPNSTVALKTPKTQYAVSGWEGIVRGLMLLHSGNSEMTERGACLAHGNTACVSMRAMAF